MLIYLNHFLNLGLADYDAVCTYKGSSISKDTGMFGSINTVAHEMGHK